MPHVTVEYSANLDGLVDLPKLLRQVHEAVMASGLFQLGAIRTRAEPRQLFVVADGDPDNAFIHVDLRIAPGRETAARQRLAQGVLDVVEAHTREVFARQGLGLSVEVREIDNTAALRLNNLHERMRAKA
jgi:5-carboxymethyl-2-hydroxymuconate isomerase